MKMETIIEEYVSKLHKNKTQKEITKQNINPIIFSNLLKDVNVLPPRSTGTNTTGRPKTKQVYYCVVHPEQQKRKMAHCCKCG